MKYLVLALALVGACSNEQVDSAEGKECHDVLKHIVSISPQTQGEDVDKVVAALPIEDIQGCMASEPEIRACMMTAADIPAVRACIPANEVLGCMQAASKLKAAAHEKAKKKDPDPVIDAPFDTIRAKAWTDRSAKPCEELKKLETTI